MNQSQGFPSFTQYFTICKERRSGFYFPENYSQGTKPAQLLNHRTAGVFCLGSTKLDRTHSFQQNLSQSQKGLTPHIHSATLQGYALTVFYHKMDISAYG